MAPPRLVQHKQRREDRRAHELADLRREKHRLAKQNDRLGEELTKAQGTRPRRVRAAPPKGPKTTGLRCWNCGADDVRTVNLGRMTMEACPDCKAHRSKP